MTTFQQLNADWNAEPNAPEPRVEVEGWDVVVSFGMNPFVFRDFTAEDIGRLRFHLCRRYRLGSTNDEGWFRGQCRFSKLAPSWENFYEVGGDLRLSECPADWVELGLQADNLHHFLFYFRDETFECDASAWSSEVWRPNHALEPTAVGADSSAVAGNIIFHRGSLYGREATAPSQNMKMT